MRGTEAHQTDRLAELVCSNSFRSDDAMGNAVGLLHEEMRRLGSLIMAMGDRHKLPAGGALAVDRDGFAAAVTEALAAEPLVTLVREEVPGLPPRGVGPGHRRHRAADLAGAGRGHPPGRRRGPARLLRRDRARSSTRRLDRPRGRLVPVALRQGGAGRRHARTTSTARSTATQYEAFVDALLAGEKGDFKDVGAGRRPISRAACRSR